MNSAADANRAALHDAYAADYDGQVRAYECYLAEVLFGLCYEYVRPGERLLDLGIGSGLSAAPFARAGLLVAGMDFSPAMLDVCRAKEIATDLRHHDLQQEPWPYPSRAFDHVIACGVFHFIPDLEVIFGEAARVVRDGGLFAFTTKSPNAAGALGRKYDRLSTDGLEIFDHFPNYVEACARQSEFERVKVLRCFVGQDVFYSWVVQQQGK